MKSGTRGYGNQQWKGVRDRVLFHCPVCEVCKAAPARDVHHRVPRRLGGTDRDDNLIAVCKVCHLAIEPLRVKGKNMGEKIDNGQLTVRPATMAGRIPVAVRNQP
jgi:hypothetical protein